MNISDIPKTKPRSYPKNWRKWAWVGDVIICHIWFKRVYGKKIHTFTERTKKGKNQTRNFLKKRFPWAFIRA